MGESVVGDSCSGAGSLKDPLGVILQAYMSR